MSRRLCLCTLLTISITLNFPLVLLFSNHRTNSKFSKDFELSESTPDSNESDSIIVTTISEETGSQMNATKGKLLQSHEDEELRRMLCPENLLQRYDLRIGICAEIDSKSHCGENMIFKEELDSSSYGYCECDFENHEVPLVFHLPSNKCYPIYTQGYCKPSEWLIFSTDVKGPVCQKNQCLLQIPKRLPTRSGRRSKLIFPWIWENSNHSDSGHDPVIKIKDNQRKSTLHQISSRLLVPLNGSGPCTPFGMGSKFCNANEKVIIGQDDIVPRCGVPGKSFRRLSIIPNACPPGSYYSIIGYCQPIWDF